MVSSTFKEEMLYRTGQYSKENPTQLATVSKIKTAKQVYTNYDQGGLEQTDGIYDFALNGNGFFCIQTSQGIRYTRNGSFSVDKDGYLVLNQAGRVLNKEGQPVQIKNENFTVGRNNACRYNCSMENAGKIQCRHGGADDSYDVIPESASKRSPVTENV